MIDVHALAAAVHLLGGSWQPWLVVLPGILIGLAVHAVPGLTTSMALAICLPLIPYMDFLQALIFMTAMYAGALFGVAIPAILLNVPGSAAAVGTTFDGFPMAQAGRHNEALGLALAASCVGQVIAYLLLLCLAQPIAAFAIRLGPPEMLMVSLWGITLIARLRGRHMARGLLAGVFGLLLGTVGLSVRGAARGTFGFDLLLDGIPTVPAIVGLFAAAELFNLVGREYIVDDRTRRQVNAGRILAGMRETFRHPGTLLRGALLGSGIGILPGGHAIANLLSYSEARRAAKDPERFGTGDPRGIIAAESANASSEGGSMATLLALGIPTGGATAVMLVAFGMHNITGGPAFMRDHADIVYAVILSSLAQVVLLAAAGFGFIFIAGFVVKVRLRLLVPIVLALAVIGSYALAQNLAGPITLAAFAVIGWLMQRFDYPVAAAVVGLLLGRLTEGALLRTYQMSGGDIGFLLTRPIALAILLLLIGSIALPYLRRGRPRLLEKRQGRIV
ncbi:MAG TPA: tripartite tricarboxylate transporter permease [Acetobacteraceae bacterium]|jgi:putative tricarboxylic transport membrane protein|nr:tripartite tricarboxylate transporter permease [Acetobacteraceae bacterium]